MVSLDDYITDNIAKPWEWGVTDCCTFAADWVFACTGIDPAAELRGTYDKDTAKRLIAEKGSLYNLVAPHMDRHFSRTEEPTDGDVGLVWAPVSYEAYGQLSAIKLGQYWVAKAMRGVYAGPFDTVAAWRIPQ